jgi:Icc-related predicted phosphoesterase
MPTVRIAAMSDVHVSKTSHGTLAPILAQVADRADVLLLCGDLTDYGTAEEARVLVKELGTLRLPTIAVLGNHDYESGTPEVVADALRDVGVTVLDGDSHEVHGIGFAGVKGFCGGFGRGTLGSWGEPMVKAFVKEALDETLKLETALARLRTPQKVAVLHYSPVRDTVEGEPLEIFPFLGCGRHEEPLVRYKVAAAFHGHAHRGTPRAAAARRPGVTTSRCAAAPGGADALPASSSSSTRTAPAATTPRTAGWSAAAAPRRRARRRPATPGANGAH